MLGAGLAVVTVLVGCGSESGGPTATDSSPSEDVSSAPTAPTAPTGSTGPTEPTSSPEAPPMPACSQVWRDGARLPADYRGCTDAAGQEVRAEKTLCSFGKPLVTYDDRFYALPGRRINATQGSLASDPDYRSAKSACTA